MDNGNCFATGRFNVKREERRRKETEKETKTVKKIDR